MRFKRTFLIGLICICTLFTASCNQEPLETDDATAEQDASDIGSENADEANPEDKNGDVSYEDLKGRVIKSRVDCHFDIGANFDLSLPLAKEWKFEFSANSASYDIIREDKVIGKIAKSSLKSDEWNIEKEYLNKIDSTFSAKRIIEKKGSGKDAEYRYRFEYEYASGKEKALINLTVDYLEIDVNSAKTLQSSPKICGASTVSDGMLSDVKDGNYLILGNSFISSSDIGTLLREMMAVNDKECVFTAVSQGYATVSTYVSDSSRMKQIENGTYDAVFICGFYSSAEVNELQALEAACKSSQTKLVVFPAHNEHQVSIDAALKKCPNVPALNWKGELDLLVESGVDKWDLCVNDAHLHSKPLAGLVGAHMIYRAIYGEIPSVKGISAVNLDEAERILGDYLTTGRVPTDYEIYTFS